jgi:NTE family protein
VTQRPVGTSTPVRHRDQPADATRRVPNRRQPRVGLVLGGGGAAGLAFHAGVLWALHHDLGWDARNADIIVGTSAGSIVGALLRSGIAAEDLAAWTTDADPSRRGREFRAVMETADRAVTRPGIPIPHLPGWHALNTLRHPSQLPGAFATMLPHGLFDHSPRVRTLERLVSTWPAEPLWISAVRVGDGRLKWFGRDPDVTRGIEPARAVAASCAIPVLSRPVRIGGHRYLDGGIVTATHADVLVGEELDLVIVLSPMGHQRGRNPMRVVAHRRVRREAAALDAAGIASQVISPDSDTENAMGFNMMDRSRVGTVMRHSFLGATTQLDAATKRLLRDARPGRAARPIGTTGAVRATG